MKNCEWRWIFPYTGYRIRIYDRLYLTINWVESKKYWEGYLSVCGNDYNAIEDRITVLRKLEPGWLDGVGEVPPSEGLDWLINIFHPRRYPNALYSLTYIYSTEDGGVRFEWPLSPYEASLDINLKTHVGEWHSLNMETDECETRTLNLDDYTDYLWLIGRILDMCRVDNKGFIIQYNDYDIIRQGGHYIVNGIIYKFVIDEKKEELDKVKAIAINCTKSYIEGAVKCIKSLDENLK